MDKKELENEIGKWDGTLERLQKSRAAGREHIAQLEAERRGYLVAARSGEDPAARERLHMVGAEIEIARRGDRDDEAAIAEVAEKLADLNAAFKAAEWEERRASIRAAIGARLDGKRERRVTELLRQVDVELSAIVASNQKIGESLRAFDRRLLDSARRAEIGETGYDSGSGRRSAAVIIGYVNQVKTIMEWDLETMSVHSLQEALGALNGLQMPRSDRTEALRAE
ncbi:MAG: hypothetical protein LAO06_02555 [Acidobacteriia bacterium]|nr:hypothetical protein [Terriglobia bacterium]